MSRAFHRFSDILVDHRWVVVLFIVSISGLSVLGYVAPHRLTDLFPSFEEEDESESTEEPEEFDTPPPVDPFSLQRADAILVVQSDNFFSPEGAKALRHIVDELEALDHVGRIVWMDRVPPLNIFGLQAVRSGAQTRHGSPVCQRPASVGGRTDTAADGVDRLVLGRK